MKSTKLYLKFSLIFTLFIMVAVVYSCKKDRNASGGALSDEFHLQRVNSVPKGVTPITFTSNDEARAFLKKVSEKPNYELFENSFKVTKDASGQKITLSPIQSKLRTMDTGGGAESTYKPTSFYNGYQVDMNYNTNGTANAVASLYGLTPGVTLTVTLSTASYNPNTHLITYNIACTQGYYILVDGFVQLSSQPVNISGTFNTQTGYSYMTVH